MADILMVTFEMEFFVELWVKYHWNLFQKGPVNNNPASVQGRLIGTQPLCELMMAKIIYLKMVDVITTTGRWSHNGVGSVTITILNHIMNIYIRQKW